MAEIDMPDWGKKGRTRKKVEPVKMPRREQVTNKKKHPGYFDKIWHEGGAPHALLPGKFRTEPGQVTFACDPLLKLRDRETYKKDGNMRWVK